MSRQQLDLPPFYGFRSASARSQAGRLAFQAAAVSLSPLSGRTGSPASHLSISSERHIERPPTMRERGNVPPRIQLQTVGKVTPAMARTSGLVSRRSLLAALSAAAFLAKAGCAVDLTFGIVQKPLSSCSAQCACTRPKAEFYSVVVVGAAPLSAAAPIRHLCAIAPNCKSFLQVLNASTVQEI